MAIFKDFTFDGENSRNYGVYISGPAVYNAPKRSMDLIQVPGRNGALAMDNGYFENIPVTYPAGSFAADQATFAEKIRALRNMLASRYRYCRLTDGYDTNHFRLALYRSGLDVDPVALHRAGEFNIAFDCKPQRYLTSGEETSTADASDPVQETYGPADIVTFESDNVQDVISSAQFAIVPQQDLNGYDSPWPAGGGVNLIEYPQLDTTINGVTFKTENGKIRITGTNGSINTAPYNAAAVTAYDTMRFGPYPAGTYTVYSTFPSVPGATRNTFQAKYADNTFAVNGTYASEPYTFTATAPFKADVWVNIAPNETVDITAQLVMNKGEAIQTWTPYSNVCPINGWAGASVTREGKNLCPFIISRTVSGATFTTQADGSVVVTGTATAQISSYTDQFVLPAGTYKVYGAPSGGYVGHKDIYVRDDDAGVVIARDYDSIADSARTFTLTKLTTLRASVRVATGETGFTFYPMICLASETDTTYEPYTSTTIPITWSEAGTVYGGTLEYLGGENWRLTRTMVAVTPTSVISSFAGTGGLRIGVVATNAKPYAASAQSTAIANMLKSMTAAAQYTGTESAVAVDAQGRCCISVTGITTFDALNSWLSANSLTCVYELSTPQTYDLTADELRTLLGVNNIWSNTGSSTVVVQSPWTLTNPTLWPSKPLIRVYGTGSFTINDVTVTVSRNTGYTDIDCEMMDCYYGGESRNQYVSFSTNDFPELRVLENYITMTGITKLEITPRWWEL